MAKIAQIRKSLVRYPYWEVTITQNWKFQEDFRPGQDVPVRIFVSKKQAQLFADRINELTGDTSA